MSSNNNLPATNNGCFQPGNKANPLGPMAGYRRISLVTTLRRKIAAQADRKRKRGGGDTSASLIADQIVEELINLALGAKTEKVKLHAIMCILQYIDGKPIVPIAVTAETEQALRERCYNAMQSVLAFAAANNMPMSNADAIAWVTAREPRAREVLSDLLTIDVTAAAADDLDAPA